MVCFFFCVVFPPPPQKKTMFHYIEKEQLSVSDLAQFSLEASAIA